MRAAIQRFIGDVILLVGVGLLLCAVGVMLIQCLRWLQDGYWTRLQFRLAWELLGQTEEPLKAHGVERLRTWVLHLPLSVGTFLWGVLAVFVGSKFSEAAQAAKHRLGHSENGRQCKAL